MEGKTLYDLHVAVIKNTCRPKAKEAKEITVKRKILTSKSLEGDSQLGMILFVGIANDLGFDKKVIMSYLSIEFEGEFEYKLRKFKSKLDDSRRKENPRFTDKVKLIKNYLRLQCSD